MPSGNETRTEPFTTVLADGTVPDYHNGCPETADTGQYPGLLVSKTSTLSENATTLCTDVHGHAVGIENTIFIIEIPRSNPAFTKSYDKSTAFPVSGIGSTYRMHRLKIGDKIWVKGSSVSGDQETMIVCAASGLVKASATSTIDVYGVHWFRPLAVYSSATWLLVEYMGPTGAADTA